MVEIKENEEKTIPVKRTMRLEARVSEAEYARASSLADQCGLTMSNFLRKCALGQHPRRRLTDREVEALCSLADARGELMRISAAVKAIQADKRGKYFSDTRFVEQWMNAAIPLIERWKQIEEYITE